MRATSASRFGGKAELRYIIEGDLRGQLHSCSACEQAPAARRGVGGCSLHGWPTLDRVEASLAALELDGFRVTRTAN
eukprot:4473399-Prymnesium_polylepis.1